MPLWPFGRKKRRTSTSTTPQANEKHARQEKEPVHEPEPEPKQERRRPASMSPAPQKDSTVLPRSEDSARRRTLPPPRDHHLAPGARDTTRPATVRKSSVQDITALPGLVKLEQSPHLRPANATKTVIPYTLDRGSPAPRMGVSDSGHPAEDVTSSPPMRSKRQSSRGDTPTPRVLTSKRKEQHIREEEIRAMSSPVPIPKRPAGVNNDLLRRDSKKARRTFSVKRNDDQRGSNVSLPLQGSIHSSMSAAPEQRAWQVGVMDILNPRPTVRLSGPGYYPTQGGSVARLSRSGSKKGKLPSLVQDGVTKTDRRRIAELADEFDSTDLRAIMERDRRRKEQKAEEEQDRLERKLRRRAEKQRRAEEEEQEREREREREREQERERQREQELGAGGRAPPTAVHPALREQPIEDEFPTRPASSHETHPTVGRQDSADAGGTYLRYPPQGDIPQNPFDDPEPSPFADPQPSPAPVTAETISPVTTPMDEPVLETARAVRLSQGHISPPTSPLAHAQAAGSLSELSDLQTQHTSSTAPRSVLEQRRTSETSSRRAGTWASIFRRGTSRNREGKATPSESSFTNVSRESMSRQPIPAHLVQPVQARHSGVPARTQSRFREDLPELPLSPPDSRVQSPELTIAAANVAAARRAKRTKPVEDAPTEEEEALEEPITSDRPESPTLSAAVLSQSLASIDSEGSWISGRPMRHSQQRDSLGSPGFPRDDFTGSYERLPLPEHEFFNTLTPSAGSRPVSHETTPQQSESQNAAAAAAAAAAASTDDGTPLRRGTARHRPTVVYNEGRHKSREGLVAEFAMEEDAPLSRESSPGSPEQSPEESRFVHKATSVNYGQGHGHAKTLSAGSARLLDIPPSRNRSTRGTPTNSPGLSQTEFK